MSATKKSDHTVKPSDAPAWTKEHLNLTGQLESNVNRRLKMISAHLQKNPKFMNLNLRLTDLTPQAQATLMGREFDNLCANPRLSDEQKQHNFKINGRDNERESVQNGVKNDINKQQALDEKIDKKLAMENDKEDKKLAMEAKKLDLDLAAQEAIDEQHSAEIAHEKSMNLTPPASSISEEELINAEEIEYLLDQQATMPTPKSVAGEPLKRTLESKPTPGNETNPESPSDQAIHRHDQIPTPEPKLRDIEEESQIIQEFVKQKSEKVDPTSTPVPPSPN